MGGDSKTAANRTREVASVLAWRLSEKSHFKLSEALPPLRERIMKAENAKKFVELGLAELSAEAEKKGIAVEAMRVAARKKRWDELELLAGIFAVSDGAVAELADEIIQLDNLESGVREFFSIFPDKRIALKLVYRKAVEDLLGVLRNMVIMSIPVELVDNFARPIFGDILGEIARKYPNCNKEKAENFLERAINLVFSVRAVAFQYAQLCGASAVRDDWVVFSSAHREETVLLDIIARL